MTRPCFLVIDREYAGSISTRKLVIETAKLNVITAFSGKEALETLQRFPAVDGIVLDAGISDMECSTAVKAFKQERAELPVIVIGTPRVQGCESADHFLDAFEPGKLLGLLRQLVPEASRILDREKAESPTEH